ncbi:MAG: YggT family protein [Alphaproteobacteria bacterium]|nr:YggT family protein [Alphaproteobacteria bacterium]
MISLLIFIINLAVQIYFWIIVVSVVLSWLINFNVVNPYSPAIRNIQYVCGQLTEPLLRPIRRFMPDLGGLDISPIVLLLGLQVVQILVIRTLTGALL